MLLRTGTGHDFKHYKRATVLRRIERPLQVTAQPDLAAYHDYLQMHPEETKALLGDMLIGVTNFFRDREAFEALERNVIPALVKSLQDSQPHREDVRIWSAGCSTGEEAYSLAIVASEQMALEACNAKLQVFATDIDDRAIAQGRKGVYPEAIVTDVPPQRMRQYFSRENQHYRVRKEIREKVLFAKHSLLADPPFSQIDLIVCRNLLIYLDRDVQREILQMFHFALRPGGYLFLGSSESADGCQDLFVPVDKRNRIFRVRPNSATVRRAPTMPRRRTCAPSAAPTPWKPSVSRKTSFADIHLRALEKCAPPSMIVDANADILHMSEGAGRFLRYVAGEITRNLLTLIQPELRLELRTTLFQVQQSGVAVTAAGCASSGKRSLVSSTSQPAPSRTRKPTTNMCWWCSRRPRPTHGSCARPAPARRKTRCWPTSSGSCSGPNCTCRTPSSNRKSPARSSRRRTKKCRRSMKSCARPPKSWKPARKSCSRSMKSC
uniref:Methyltransferase n=1 Tax=Pseudomonas fluorescens TaxID=294 RepID=Q51774_PSEFL|nr:methyltransferase [Pseudomonas fluorescens]